ncbi:mCG147124 [Mus musculus]|uniref:Uncharacterized protein n=1 Tax=Mus musculus TaxID=10090 RepID=Q8CDX6_MOUSE|nr:mCG147124 [Mus musculus]BAC26439.1 unnamed protein product [Mus musculus]
MPWLPAKLCLRSDQSPSIIYLSSFPWEAGWSILHPQPDPAESLDAALRGAGARFRYFSLFTHFNAQSVSPCAAPSPPPARAESWDGFSANRQCSSDPLSHRQRVLEEIRRND